MTNEELKVGDIVCYDYECCPPGNSRSRMRVLPPTPGYPEDEWAYLLWLDGDLCGTKDHRPLTLPDDDPLRCGFMKASDLPEIKAGDLVEYSPDGYPEPEWRERALVVECLPARRHKKEVELPRAVVEFLGGPSRRASPAGTRATIIASHLIKVDPENKKQSA